jgi:pilus assembly protein CpaE
MNSMATQSSKISVKEIVSGTEPLTVVGLGLEEEMCRFLDLFAASSSLIRVRYQLALRNGGKDTDAICEQVGPLLPHVCLLDFDGNRRAAAALAERMHTRLPGVAIFAVSSQSQPNAIIEAMRCGCSEYLVKPVDRDQLANAVVRVGMRRKERQDQSRAQLLAFMGAKGGCGVTTIATQLGALLANSCGRKTLLVDLHPDFGDAALYLKLTKTHYNFFELLENADRLDADFLESFVIEHSSGLELIPAPECTVTSRDGIPAGALNNTVEFLRSRYEFIVADLAPSLNDSNLSVIRDCDQLYLVTVAEVAAIRNVVRQLEYLQHKEIPSEKIRVVVNRHHKRNVVTDAQIEKAIERNIYWRVPNHYPQVVKAIHEGDPIAQLQNSEVTRTLEQLAAEVGKKPGNENKKPAGGLLGLFGR